MTTEPVWTVAGVRAMPGWMDRHEIVIARDGAPVLLVAQDGDGGPDRLIPGPGQPRSLVVEFERSADQWAAGQPQHIWEPIGALVTELVERWYAGQAIYE